MTEVGDLQELALSTDEAGTDRTPRPRTSLSSAATRGTITGLGILSLAVPVIVYLWFIHRYSVNMIWGDAWSDINVIEHAHAGNLSLATLWAQHNENRIFFPNLIVVVLGDTTHFNTVIEEYLSAAMLIIATGLLILTHRRRRPSTPWFYYCPVAILMFSLVGGNPLYASTNTLWAFQMAWYLVLLGLAVTLFLLDRPSLTWLVLAGAIAIAAAAGYFVVRGGNSPPASQTLSYRDGYSAGNGDQSGGALVAWSGSVSDTCTEMMDISSINGDSPQLWMQGCDAGLNDALYSIQHPGAGSP